MRYIGWTITTDVGKIAKKNIHILRLLTTYAAWVKVARLAAVLRQHHRMDGFEGSSTKL